MEHLTKLGKLHKCELVADQLLISVDTIRDHVKNIYRKLEINSKGELIAKKLRGELV